MKSFFRSIYLFILYVAGVINYPWGRSNKKEIFRSCCDIPVSETCAAHEIPYNCWFRLGFINIKWTNKRNVGTGTTKCDHRWDFIMRAPHNKNKAWKEVFASWHEKLCTCSCPNPLTLPRFDLD